MSQPLRSRSGLLLLIALCLVLVQALPEISYPLGRDQATFYLIGHGLAHGQALYRDLWDNKPPGIFYFYALIATLCENVMQSAGIADLLLLLALSILLFKFCEPLIGAAGAAAAVAVNAALHIRAGYWDAAQPEVFIMLFIFGAYLLLERSRVGSGSQFSATVAAGALFAAAVWVKYNAAVFLPFLAIACFESSSRQNGVFSALSRWERVAKGRARTFPAVPFVTGFSLLSAALLIHLASAGSWNGFIEEQFQVLPRYARFATLGVPHYGLWAAHQTEKWLGLWDLLFAPIALVIAWRKGQIVRLAPIFVGACCGVLALIVQLRYQPYYFEICYPFFAIFWAIIAVETFAAARSLAQSAARRNWHLARMLLWVAFAALISVPLRGPVIRMVVNYRALVSWHRDRRTFYADYVWPGAGEHFRDDLRVAAYLNHHSFPADRVYIWGNAPLIYDLTGQVPPSRFIWDLPLITPWGLPNWRRELMSDLERTQPTFVIVARHDEVHNLSGTRQDSEHALQDFPALASFIRRNYQLCANYPNFKIYRSHSSRKAP